MAAPEVIGIDEAHRRMASVGVPLSSVQVPLDAALGRTLAHSLSAPQPLPPFDRAAMDGYAVRAEGLAPGQTLPVAGRVAAGDEPRRLVSGTALRILTGAPLPSGADAVVEQESVERVGSDAVRFLRAVRPGWNVMRRGHELQAGDAVAEAGTRLTAYHLGLAAALGLSRITVRRRPRVAVLETGSELVGPTTVLRPGQIYASQAALFRALLMSYGARVVGRGRVPDRLEAVVAALREAAARADLVIVTGGVSVGDLDFVPAALEEAGRLLFWRVAMHPGRAAAFGTVGASAVLALSGNPGAAVTSWLVLGGPWWAHWHGGRPVERWTRDQLVDGFPKPSRETRLVRVRRAVGGVTADVAQGADVLTAYLDADGFAVLPAGSGPIAPGETVDVWQPGGMGGRAPRWVGPDGGGPVWSGPG